jgi:hypothetical protein
MLIFPLRYLSCHVFIVLDVKVRTNLFYTYCQGAILYILSTNFNFPFDTLSSYIHQVNLGESTLQWPFLEVIILVVLG